MYLKDKDIFVWLFNNSSSYYAWDVWIYSYIDDITVSDLLIPLILTSRYWYHVQVRDMSLCFSRVSSPSALSIILAGLPYSWLSTLTANGFILHFKGSASRTQHWNSAQLWYHCCAERSTDVWLYLKELPFLSRWESHSSFSRSLGENSTEIHSSSNAVLRSSKIRLLHILYIWRIDGLIPFQMCDV